MTEILITDLTTKDKDDGTGVFDQIMQTFDVRMQEELDNNRIPVSDYPKIYLGAMDTALSQSIAFLLQKQTAAAQADLIIAQTANETLKGLLLTAETAKTNAEKLLIDNNAANAVIQGVNLGYEGLGTLAKTSLIGAQEFKLVNIDTPLTVAETQKLGKEEDLIDEDILKTVAETALINQNTANALATANIIPKSGLKIDAEIGLLTQKTYTEEASTKDTVGPTGSTYSVSGMILKQKDLYTAQKEGFARDAEQKLSKIVADAWSVRSSVDPDTMTEPAGIADTDVSAILAVAKTGIGA